MTADNWKGSSKSKSVAGVDTRWVDGMTALSGEQVAQEAYETVLTKAGCSFHRDDVDERIIRDVRNGSGGIINTPAEVGGWPELKPADRPQDSDADGITDEWEEQYGLNPSKPLDAQKATLVDGMSNLEVYLCHLVRDLY